jgi:hypothetical protein
VPTQKSIGLCSDPQKRAFSNAVAAVEAADDTPDDPTDGEVVRELSEAYTGYGGGDVDR